LKMRNRLALDKLRSVLSDTRDSRLRVKLVDRAPFARFFNCAYFYKKLGIEQTVEVPVDLEMTPCERVTRVVYKEIDSTVKRELERAGQTERPITLDYVFDLLLKEQIEPFMKKELTQSERDDPCFKDFTLLKWLRNEDVPGFEFSRYRLTPDIT